MPMKHKQCEILQFTNLDLKSVVTPVKADTLNKLLIEVNYPRKKRLFLVKGFKKGFSLQYRGNRKVRMTSPNLKFTVGDKVVLWNKVMKEVQAKRYAGPFPYDKPPFEYFIQSPIGLVPKDGGRETRLIFHLSHPRRDPKNSVNGNIPEWECKVH